MDLEPGEVAKTAEPMLSPVAWKDGRLTIPDEPMTCCDLMLTGTAVLTLDGTRLIPTRSNTGKGWQIAAYDLRQWRGKQVQLAPVCNDDIFGTGAHGKAWLVMDRPVADAPADTDPKLPWPIAQGFRRQTMQLFDCDVKNPMPAHKMTADDWKKVRAAKVRIETFDLDIRAGGTCQIMLGDSKVLATVSRNRQYDLWEPQMIDVPAELLPSIAASNTLSIMRERDGGKFKFRGLTLAVQLGNGSWVHSNVDSAVQSSYRDWRSFEGQLFSTPQRSQSVTLRFDE